MNEKKYAVIEMQKQADGSLATITTDHNSLPEAQNKYFTVLAAAAISTVPIHTAMLVGEDGFQIARDSFVHVTV